MGTLKGGYFLKNGTKVPSVTTILGRWKESGGLIHWAAGQAAEYVARNVPDAPTRADVLKLCEQAKTAYRTVRDAAADAGTLAHDAVEAWIRGNPVVFEGRPEVVQHAQKSFNNFLEWASQTQLHVTHTECPLVSETYAFGGTLDAMLIRNKRSLGDWKCSNALYQEYLCQIAAYGILWEENHPDQPIDGGYHLLRFDRTHADFTHRYWSELDDARTAFLYMLKLYQLDKELKLRIR